MATILIQNGCMHVTGQMWLYDYEDNAGSHQIYFTATQAPKIGDSIDVDNAVLVPLVGYIINNDPGVAQGQQFEDSEWPSRIRAQ